MSWSWKKCPDCVHPWVFHSKCTFKSSYEKKFQNIFLQDLFFLCFMRKCLLKYPSSTKPHLPWKIFCWVPAFRYYSFCKILPLKYLTVFWIHPFLDDCSVICTAILCYVLHQTHSEFWYIQAYSSLRHNHTYWRIIKAYSALFRDIQHPV